MWRRGRCGACGFLILHILVLWSPLSVTAFYVGGLLRAGRVASGSHSSPAPIRSAASSSSSHQVPPPLVVVDQQILDVEDESGDDPVTVEESMMATEGSEEEAKEDIATRWEARLKEIGALTEDGQVDYSSRTLKALRAAQEETRAVVAKASESLMAFGSYAASKALADTELILRVTVVVAAELSTRITPLLLPSARASEPSEDTAVKLTLREKIDLAALGIFPQQQSQSQFLVQSFSDAGNKDALIEDMYRKVRQNRGVVLPEKGIAGALRIPLKVVASLPSLPYGMLKTANKVYELGKEASDRSATRQVIKVFNALPAISASAAMGRRLMSEANRRTAGSRGTKEVAAKSGGGRVKRPLILKSWMGQKQHPDSTTAPQEQENWREAGSTRAQAYAAMGEETAEMEALALQAVRGGGDAVTAASKAASMASGSAAVGWSSQAATSADQGPDTTTTTKGGTTTSNRRHRQQSRPSSTALAAVASSNAAWPTTADDGTWKNDDYSSSDVIWTTSSSSSAEEDDGEGRRLRVYAASEEGVIDTVVEDMGYATSSKNGEDPVLVVLLLKVMDLLLLCMEKVVLEAMPAALTGVSLASRRVNQVLTGARGTPGWELLSSFERPMSSSAQNGGR